MKRPRLFIAAAILFVGGMIGTLVNVLSIYDIVNEVDVKTADARLDKVELIGDICAAVILLGVVLFLVWVWFVVRDSARQSHVKAAKEIK